MHTSEFERSLLEFNDEEHMSERAATYFDVDLVISLTAR